MLNKIKWEAVLGDPETSDSLKGIITEFFMRDDLDFDKCIENQKANSTVDSFSGLEFWEKLNSISIEQSKKINCTKTFREHFSNNRLNRGLSVPDWFYIGYPDVAKWMEESGDDFDRELSAREDEFMDGDKISLKLFRFLIDRYKSTTRHKLECV